MKKSDEDMYKTEIPFAEEYLNTTIRIVEESEQIDFDLKRKTGFRIAAVISRLLTFLSFSAKLLDDVK